MKRLYFVLSVSLLVFLTSVCNAQEVSPVDFMRLNPFQIYSNPATYLPYNSFFHIGIGNVSATVQNSSLYYDNLFDFGPDGLPTTINLKKFANSLDKHNFMNLNLTENIYGFGCDFREDKVTYSHRLRVQGSWQYDDGLFKLLAYGNSAFVGNDNPATMRMNLDLMAFQEFALGYQTNVNSKLSIGVRGKLLFGLANIDTEAFSATMYTDPDSYAIRLYEDIGLRTTLARPYELVDGKMKWTERLQFQDLFRNVGFGVDLAGEYKIDDKWSAVVAINDLGFVKWKQNGMEIHGGIAEAGQFYEEGSFFFDGLDVNEVQLIVSDEYYRQRFLDTLGQYFNLHAEGIAEYKTRLHTDIMLRGNYDINKNNRLSAQLQGYFSGYEVRPAFTLAYSGSFYKKIDVAATYTMMKNVGNTFGLGLGLNLDWLHLYAATNNLFGLMNPLNSRGVSVQAGVVLNFRARTKIKIVEIVPIDDEEE